MIKDVMLKDQKSIDVEASNLIYRIKGMANEVYDVLSSITPKCREIELGKARLEESIMWVTKGIYLNGISKKDFEGIS